MADHVNPAILAGEAAVAPGDGDVALACGRVLILGEDNPQSTRAEHALVPWPDGCAGHRLMRIMGLPEAAYLSTRRMNLCCPAWDVKEARTRAAAILRVTEPDTLIVALGAKVRDAIHHPYRALNPPPAFFAVSDHGGDPGAPHHFRVAYLPHPSGRNQIWNDPQVAIRARALLRELAPLVPWGQALS